jgi:hypothetical protein
MKELIGKKRVKPFECVGTFKESLISLYLSWEKAKKREKMSFLLKYFEKEIVSRQKNLEQQAKRVLNSWNKENFLPKDFEKILKSEF